jgi:hypothetical protein
MTVWSFRNKGLLRGKSPSVRSERLLVEQIALHQLLEQLVPVQLTDHAAGTIVVGDVGGILGEKITNDLVDGIVALLAQSVENTAKDSTHIVLIVTGNCKLDGVVVRHVIDLLCILGIIIAQIFGYVKGKSREFFTGERFLRSPVGLR